jgi:hypothetical protein
MAHTTENIEHNTGARKDNIFLSTRYPERHKLWWWYQWLLHQHWLYHRNQQHCNDDSDGKEGYNRD